MPVYRSINDDHNINDTDDRNINDTITIKMNFLKNLFGSSKPVYEPKITVEKIQQIFEYGKLKNLIGTGTEGLEDLPLGANISWVSDSKFRKAYKEIPEQIVPPHVQWSNNPIFAYVAIVDDKVQYHYGENGESAVFICPQTTATDHLKLIDKIFDHYYQQFDLPNSITEIKTDTAKAGTSDKIKFLSTYLTTYDGNFFQDNFYENDDIDQLVMWIDWREEDENIITYCENILETKQLSVATIDAENKRGFDIIITYKRQQTTIPYKGTGADRDTTVKALNDAIKADFEIRLCKETAASDTLCLLPLSNTQWLELEKRFPKEVADKFEKITDSTVLFK
jgi:hypothetical protein